MKTKFILMLFIFAILFVALPHKAKAQLTDTCWCPPLSYPPTGQLVNQDSAIVFDTCGIRYPSANCDSAFWDNTGWRYYPEAKGNVYAKKYWDVGFNVPAIVLDSVSADSLLYVTHDAIDSINYPNIKNVFKQLEIIYGTYRLRKVHPQETIGERSQYFSLYFDNYVKIGEVEYYLDTMKNIYCEFANWPSISGSNVDDIKTNYDFKIEPDVSQSFIKILSNNNLRIKSIKIYNILGELLYYYSFIDNDIFTININNYSTGLYIIAINEQIYKFYVLR
ncbi:MAG: hypothetical protein A2X61_00180 [Ignavibacteria bacterium GWB2_35_12]|nr:MAG: hypothetical protein A2X61_00180 [Ignavibacteria bacterium GWB2_35_12]